MSASGLSACFAGAGLSARFVGGGGYIVFLTGEKFSARCVKEWRTVAFKHLNSRQVTDAQWDHVESLGVKNSYGNKFNRDISHMTVDRERGYCLVRCGATHPRGLFEDGSDREIYFYALCLDNNAFYFDVEEKNFGKVVENNFEVQWNIERIKFPDGWNFDSLSVDEFKKIVVEAFTCESIQGVVTPERLKKIVVEFPDNFEKQIKN